MTDTQNTFIPLVRQEIWGWPAVVNLVLGGMASGFYLFNLIDTALGHQAKVLSPLLQADLLSPMLVATGFLTVGIEAGRPRNGRFLLHHLKRSWMSREVLSGLLFILFALAHWVYPAPALNLLGAAAATSLMVCQGFMVFRAYAVVAWADRLTAGYFITSALALGFGLTLCFRSAVAQADFHLTLLLIGLVTIGLNAAAWYVLIRPKADPIKDRSRIHLRNPLSMTLTLGIGHLVPVMLLIILAAMEATGFTGGRILLLHFFAGMCILLGGVFEKTELILQANALLPIRSGIPQYNEPICPHP